MLLSGLKAQAAILTAANMIVRAAGFLLRILLSRHMGAQAIGIMELAASIHMLAITPLTAGLPLAVSRLTAKAEIDHRFSPLSAGRWLVNRASAFLIPLFLLLIPFISRLSGDERTLPSLIFTAPCIWILGHSAVLNGYYYGIKNALVPAFSEILEQALRFIICLVLLMKLRHLTVAWMAAISPFATMTSEAVGLLFTVCFLKKRSSSVADSKMIRQVAKLSLPPTLNRLCNTGLRSISAMLIPIQLTVSGLTSTEATSRLGMLTGMAMPLVMLPGVFTGAIAMLAAPALASKEKSPPQLRRVTAQFLGASFFISCLSAVALYVFSPFVAMKLYRQPDLIALIRLLCPSVVITSMNQVLSGMIAGIGRQQQSLWGTLIGSAVTLALTLILTCQPQLREMGAAIAMMSGQTVMFIWNSEILRRALIKNHS